MDGKEYIERGAILALFDKVGCYLNLRCLERQQEQIRQLPAADVAEVRHGKWMPIVIQESYFDPPYCDTCKCSMCGYEIDVSETIYNYCPYCGAKMDGKGEYE